MKTIKFENNWIRSVLNETRVLIPNYDNLGVEYVFQLPSNIYMLLVIDVAGGTSSPYASAHAHISYRFRNNSLNPNTNIFKNHNNCITLKLGVVDDRPYLSITMNHRWSRAQIKVFDIESNLYGPPTLITGSIDTSGFEVISAT